MFPSSLGRALATTMSSSFPCGNAAVNQGTRFGACYVDAAISTTRSRVRGPVTRASPGYPNGLRLHVLVHAPDSAALTTEPAQLEAAEWRVTGTDAVDRDLAGADAAGHSDGSIYVATPHGTGQSVPGVVRDRYRVVVVAVPQHRQHGPEHFFLRNGRIRLDLVENRRFEVEADVQAGWPTAAGRQLCSVVERPGDVVLDAAPLFPADQRPHLYIWIGGVTDLDVTGQRHQPINDVVVQRIRKQQPAVQDAGLPGMQGTALEQHLMQHFVGHSGVVENDARGLAAQLQQDPLQRVTRCGHDFPADDRAAGEADHVDSRVGGEQLGGLNTWRCHDVDDAWRDVGVLVNHPSQREPGERRQRRRFEHEGIAGGQRVVHLHHVEAVREVPRRQNRHDTEWLMTQQCRSGTDAGDRLVDQLRGELGRVHRHECGAVDLHHALIPDAAPFDLRQREELVSVLQQCVAELIEAGCAVLDADIGPWAAVVSAPRGRDRLADLGDARVGRGGDAFFGDRGDVVVATVLRLDPSPVDVELVGVD